MGRFKIGAGLLAVLLALAVGTQLGMKAAQQPVAQSLAEAMEQVQREHFPEAEALVAQARQQWDCTRTFRAALADHQCLEDIDSQLAMLAVWVREQEKADFSALCADTLLRLKAVAEAHALNLSTFF